MLIPVFAVGRAQELCILIETYWERMGLTVPIYFSAGNASLPECGLPPILMKPLICQVSPSARTCITNCLSTGPTRRSRALSLSATCSTLSILSPSRGPFHSGKSFFDEKPLHVFVRQFLDNPGPMVLFATPGMLHAGTSLDAFKRWCSRCNRNAFV